MRKVIQALPRPWPMILNCFLLHKKSGLEIGFCFHFWSLSSRTFTIALSHQRRAKAKCAHPQRKAQLSTPACVSHLVGKRTNSRRYSNPKSLGLLTPALIKLTKMYIYNVTRHVRTQCSEQNLVGLDEKPPPSSDDGNRAIHPSTLV